MTTSESTTRQGDAPQISTGSVFKMQKLKGQCILLHAAKHNLRESQAERGAGDHIDVARTPLNQILVGPNSADGVNRHARALMEQAGITKLRVDAVRALELLFTLAPGHPAVERGFFQACLKWVSGKYGSAQILSAVIHLDEGAPHMHVLVLPLLNGKMNGSRLMGNAPHLHDMHVSLHREVTRHYGLRPPQPRLTTRDRERAYRQVLEELRSRQDPLLKSELKDQLLQLVRRYPELCFEPLGIQLSPQSVKRRTMTQIFTSKGRGKGPQSKTGSRGYAGSEA